MDKSEILKEAESRKPDLIKSLNQILGADLVDSAEVRVIPNLSHYKVILHHEREPSHEEEKVLRQLGNIGATEGFSFEYPDSTRISVEVGSRNPTLIEQTADLIGAVREMDKETKEDMIKDILNPTDLRNPRKISRPRGSGGQER